MLEEIPSHADAVEQPCARASEWTQRRASETPAAYPAIFPAARFMAPPLGSETRSAARAVADVARRLGQPSGGPVLVDVVRVGLELLDRLLVERAVRVQDRVERPVHHDADAHLVLGHVGEDDVRRDAVARSRRADVGIRIPAVDRMAVRVLSESAPRGIRRGVRRAHLGGRADGTRRYTRKFLAAVADAVDQLLDAEIVLLLAEEHLV